MIPLALAFLAALSALAVAARRIATELSRNNVWIAASGSRARALQNPATLKTMPDRWDRWAMAVLHAIT